MNRFFSSVLLFGCMWVQIGACGFERQGFAGQGFAEQAESTDATIHACVVVSADRWWAFGERGQALLSENAGRTWSQAIIDGMPNIYAGVAIDERNGVLVGGTVQPYSHRSVGVVQTTHDGGRRWREIPCDGLSRLTGIQKIGPRHWIAWGDWSPTFCTALFETTDGGETWNGIKIAASHIQTAAWKEAANGIVVDRLGRVFRIEPGKPASLLDVGGNASNRILKAAYCDSGWWLIGQGGQIYQSVDGYQWQRKFLPGNATDHALIRLADIAFQSMNAPANSPSMLSPNSSSLQSAASGGALQSMSIPGSGPRADKRCWLVGSPGSVIWSSDDLGESWQIQATSQSMPLNAIAAAGSDTLFAAGGLATIIGTKNAGEGWWILGQEGSRLALLSLTALQANIPWDALALVARESRAHVGGIVFHSERTHERASPWCESETRASLLASELGFFGIETIQQFPLRSLPNGRLNEEMTIYDSKLQKLGMENLVDRIAVHMIRQFRPDVIVCDGLQSEDPVVLSAARMVMTARNRASDSRYSCFSAESGIADKPWECKTLLARTPSHDRDDRRRTELQLASTTPVHREGILLGEILLPVGGQLTESAQSRHDSNRFDADQEAMPVWEQYGDYALVYGARPSGGKSSLLPDEIRQPGALRPSRMADSPHYQATVSSFQREINQKKLVDLEVDVTTRDSRWLAALRQFLLASTPATRSHSLWNIAQESRRRGHWDRWSTCLDLLIGEYPKDGAAELAVLQQAAWRESSELRIWRQQTGASVGTPIPASNVVTASHNSIVSSSPFEGKQNDAPKLVAAVSHSNETRSPSRSTLQSQVASRMVNSVSPAPKVTRSESISSGQLGLAGENPESRFSIITSVARSRMEFDPRKILLELSGRREFNADWNGLYGWSHVAAQEFVLRAQSVREPRVSEFSNSDSSELKRRQSPLSIMTVPLSKYRPILDGSLGEDVWRESHAIQLQSLGSIRRDNRPDTLETSTIKIVRDLRFLYICGSCLRSADVNSEVSVSTIPREKKLAGRTHDQQGAQDDRFTLRIDTDRDFLTWFQFSVDSHGNVTDAINDMGGWDPRWYVATASTEAGWTFELAIPLAEISNEDLAKSGESVTLEGGTDIVWNFAMCRTAPGREVEQSRPLMLQGLAIESWIPGALQR